MTTRVVLLVLSVAVAVVAIAASMLSSRISQEEENRE